MLAVALGVLGLATVMFATAPHQYHVRQPAALWWGK